MRWYSSTVKRRTARDMPILSTLLGAKGKRTACATMRRAPEDLVTGVLRSGPFLRRATTRSKRGVRGSGVAGEDRGIYPSPPMSSCVVPPLRMTERGTGGEDHRERGSQG